MKQREQVLKMEHGGLLGGGSSRKTKSSRCEGSKKNPPTGSSKKTSPSRGQVMLKLAMSKKANTTVKSIKVGAKSDWDKSNLMGNAFPQVGDRFDAQKEPALFVSEKELLRMRSLANLPLDCGVWQ